ncbi:MAG: hypothetical protein R2939_07915 [Kofleriaceae bacterium]
MATARLTAGTAALLAQASGSPTTWPAKAQRLAGLLGRYAGRVHRARLRQLHAAGTIDEVPTHAQLAVGALEMVRFWITPAAAEYYQHRGISFGLHQVLRLLEEPASLADPVGLLSTRDAIIGHLMQVVHANPRYDLELLTMYPDGVAELEAQLRAMIAGHHPRARAIGAIVEEADYHARLLAYVREFRRDPAAPAPLRDNIAGDGQARWAARERTFGGLRTSVRYFCRLPPGWPAALAHLARTTEFPVELAEPAGAAAGGDSAND